MKSSIVAQKSEDFAVRIINLNKHLKSKKKEYIMSDQILRSGTSICANLAESACGISRGDWLAKVYIAYKECAETLSWLRLLKRTEYITQKQFDSLYLECEEIYKILASITKTSRLGKTPNF